MNGNEDIRDGGLKCPSDNAFTGGRMSPEERLAMKGKKRILFICLGNICRSPAAEGVMKSIVAEAGAHGYEIDSAGIGRYHIGQLPDPRMRVHARRRGLELDHYCRQVKATDFDDFDLVIGMDDRNIRDLHVVAPSPEAEEKIVAMRQFFEKSNYYDHVPDPYYGEGDGFELVLNLLEEGCRNLFNAIEGR